MEESGVVQAVWGLLVLTGVVGMATTFILQGFRKASAWLDGRAPVVKQLAAVVIAELLTWLSNLTGIALPTDLAALDVTAVQGLLGAGFAMGFYTILKALGFIKPGPPR